MSDARRPQRLARRAFLSGTIGAAGLAAAGCSIFGEDSDASTDEGEVLIRISQQANPIDSLDPHYTNASMYIVPAALLEGLVIQNEEGTDVQPGLAETWDMSDDGLTYTFHLRQGMKWSNDDPITADDVIFSYQRLLSPTGATGTNTTGSSSYLPSAGIHGAAEYQSGSLDDWNEVGITAPDENTVEIVLDEPNPDLLITTSHYSMLTVHPKSVEDHPDDWTQPANWVGNGPFTLTKWDANSIIELKKNPNYWDADNVAADRITCRIGADSPSNTLAFKNDELDIISVGPDAIKNDPDLEKQVIKADGYATNYLQTMWGGHPAIQDKRVRQALSMAIDRKALVASDPAGQPAGTLIPSSVPGWSDELAIAFDPDGAKTLLSQAGLDKLPPLRVQADNDNPMFEVLKEVWKDSIGAELNIDILEAGVHADSRWQPYEDTSVLSYYAGSFAGYSTLTNWIYNLFGVDYVRQFSLSADDWQAMQDAQSDESLSPGEKSKKVGEILNTKSSEDAQEFVRLAKEAKSTTDENEQVAKYIQAAKVREDMAQTVPLAWSALSYAATDSIDGLHPRRSPEGYYYKYLTKSAS